MGIPSIASIPGIPGIGGGGGTAYGNGTLTFTGGLITDAVRTTDVEGDGLTPPAGVGIWPAATNLVTNGGFETNTTGWAAYTTETIARSTEWSKFGDASLKVTNLVGSEYNVSYAFTAPGAGTYVVSAWVNVSSDFNGTSIQQSFTDYAGASFGSAQTILAGEIKRISRTITFDAGDLVGALNFFVNGATSAGHFYVDGFQMEAGSIATPYIETDGGTASRVAGRVQQPVSGLLTATQGWFAARLRTGWGNGGASGNPRVAQWRVDGSNRVALLYNNGANLWQTTRVASGTGTSANVAGGTFTSGDTPTVVSAWESTRVRTSLNGGTFTSAADANIPNLAAQTTVDIGSEVGVGDYLYGDVLWYATGSGTLTNADAAALNAFGDTPPTPGQLQSLLLPAAAPTSLWKAVDTSYERIW